VAKLVRKTIPCFLAMPLDTTSRQDFAWLAVSSRVWVVILRTMQTPPTGAYLLHIFYLDQNGATQ